MPHQTLGHLPLFLNQGAQPRRNAFASGLVLGNVDASGGAVEDNEFADDNMADALGMSRPPPITQFMRGYSGSSHPATFAASSVANAADYGGRAFLNAKNGGDYATANAGGFDSAWTTFWNSWPVGIPGWMTWQHEPENDGIPNPDDWCQAMGRYVNVGAPIVRSRGLRVGIGGLLMGSFTLPTNVSANWSTWNWWQYVDAANYGQTVWMVDEYAQHINGTPPVGEDMHAQLDRMFGKIRDETGITRFAAGELAISREERPGTAIIGTTATQEAWIRQQLPRFRTIEGFEAACYFHDPAGPASGDADITGGALLAWAQACRGDF